MLVSQYCYHCMLSIIILAYFNAGGTILLSLHVESHSLLYWLISILVSQYCYHCMLSIIILAYFNAGGTILLSLHVESHSLLYWLISMLVAQYCYHCMLRAIHYYTGLFQCWWHNIAIIAC